MRKVLAVAAVGAAVMSGGDLASAATGYVPTVQEVTAVRMTRLTLTEHWPGWSFKTYGYVDCYGGRINRTHWRCRVAWVNGRRRCHIGRSQVFGDRVEEGTHYYGAHLKIYGCHFGSR